MNHTKKFIFIFSLIIVLAVILRMVGLDRFPPSLYTDEVNQGYNAYSLLLTGKDEHGVFLPVSLRSFGDWKPPMPTYLMIPFIYLFGLNEISVRLPSAILGTGSVILSFFLVKKIFSKLHPKNRLALLTMFLITISPWHILQSRAAMLVIVSLFFLQLAVYLFLLALEKPKFLIWSFISFSLTIYAYYGMRVITPLIVIFLLFNFRNKIIEHKGYLITSLLILSILMLPLITAFWKNPDVVFGRARTVSVFYDQGVKLRQWELFAQDGVNYSTFLSRFFHNNLYMYFRNIINRFLSHFDGRFLFLIGDQSPPFQIPKMGILYLVDGVFIILGLIFLFLNYPQGKELLLVWLIISIIPASLTFMTPSSNRTFNMVFPLLLLVTIGMLSFINNISVKYKFPMSFMITIFYLGSFYFFLQNYLLTLPEDHSDWWNYGWKQVVATVSSLEKNYKEVVVSDQFGMPYIYFLFYNRYPPDKYQTEAVKTYNSDRFGFEHVDGFSHYLFPDDFSWERYDPGLWTKTLFIVPSDLINDNLQRKEIIYYPNKKPGYYFYEYP